MQYTCSNRFSQQRTRYPSHGTIVIQNWVIQYDFPTKPKIFIHRSGRTARAGQCGKTVSIIATNETMYVLDLLLHIGRKLTCENNFDNAGEKAFFGQIPFDLLTHYVQAFMNILKDPDIFRSNDTAEKAFTQFIKTRPSASKSSSQQSKLIDFTVVFPLIQKDAFMIVNQQQYLKEIDNFKPKESYLDLKTSGKLRNSTFNENLQQSLMKIKSYKQKSTVIEQNKVDQTFISDTEAKRINKIMNFESNSDKLKRSQIKDFKDQRFFISDTPKFGKAQNSFVEDGKINTEDINAYVIAEDTEDLLKQRKNYVWDSKKKRFVRGKLNEKGYVEKEKQGVKNKFSSKKVYDKWSKQHQIKRQKEGEVEDKSMIQRASNLFKTKGKFGVKNTIPGVKSELKSSQQIMKSKKIKKNSRLKNMEKGKRTKIEGKMRQNKMQLKQQQNKQKINKNMKSKMNNNKNRRR